MPELYYLTIAEAAGLLQKREDLVAGADAGRESSASRPSSRACVRISR